MRYIDIARQEDCELLSALAKSTFYQTYPHILEDESPSELKAIMDERFGEAAIRHALQDPYSQFFIVRDDKGPIGFVQVYLSKTIAYLDKLFVLEGYKLNGVGRQLLYTAMRYALVHGCDSLEAIVEEENPDGIAFLLRNGLDYKYHFNPIGEHHFCLFTPKPRPIKMLNPGTGPERYYDYPLVCRNLLIATEDMKPKLGEIEERVELDYRHDPLLGEGKYSRVYLGSLFDNTVAVKSFRKRFTAIAEREASFLRELASPHVVTVYPYASKSAHHIVLEYLDGGSLSHWLVSHKGLLCPITSTKIALDVADALTCLHDYGVLHGDIKPDNVLVTARGDNAKLTDFNVSRRLKKNGFNELEPTKGLAYADAMRPPEVNSTDGYRIARASDIFAFGAILFDLSKGGRSRTSILYSQYLINQKTTSSKDSKPHYTFDQAGYYQALVASAAELPNHPGQLPKEVAQLLSSCWSLEIGGRKTALSLTQSLHQTFQALISPIFIR